MIRLKNLLSEAGKFYLGSPHNDEPFGRNGFGPWADNQSIQRLVDRINSLPGVQVNSRITPQGGVDRVHITIGDTDLFVLNNAPGRRYDYAVRRADKLERVASFDEFENMVAELTA